LLRDVGNEFQVQLEQQKLMLPGLQNLHLWLF
jgi:hypothetical protein